MRLTSIKLSGFKSFVDPTTIALPGQLVGIVGPNGCGKSNVIDAVRWVLGESKASALRGESMDDVIFNGGGERKPVARASVELVFDNASGRAAGQWSQYAELSVKRVVQRDVGSSYYINNQAVRRRDILDVFLGTGLGPRAYAVIEQGMISRIIEAKPEELRVFLEEAAGVSRYKERRKETEGRLGDTRENLARVHDIQTELTSQVERLEGQAKIAARYRELEKEKLESQALLFAQRREEAVKQRESAVRVLGENETALLAKETEVQALATQLEGLRQDVFTKNDAQHTAQGAFYEINSEVTRIEQQLSFERDRAQRVAQEVAQRQARLANAQEQAGQLDEALAEANDAVAVAAAKHVEQKEFVDTAGTALPLAETALRAASTALADVQQAINAIDSEAQLSQLKKSTTEKSIAQLQARQLRLTQERERLNAPEDAELIAIDEQLEGERAELEAAEQTAQEAEAAATHADEERAHRRAELDVAQRKLGELRARENAIGSVQAKFGNRGEGQLQRWLDEHQIRGDKFWSKLKVDAGWEDAVEAVLRDRLNALPVASLEEAMRLPVPPARLTVFAGHSAATAYAHEHALASHVRADDPAIASAAAHWLHGVRVAETTADALAVRASLASGEVIVTREGHLVGANSITWFAPDEAVHGAMARQRELTEIAAHLSDAQAAASKAETAFAHADKRYQDLRVQATQQRGAIVSVQRRVHNLEVERLQIEQARAQATERTKQISDELAEIGESIAAEQEHVQSHVEALAIADEKRGAAHADREIKRGVRNEADVALVKAREALRGAEIALRDAMYGERAAQERVQDLSRRIAANQQQIKELDADVARLLTEQSSILLTPLEEGLQSQLNVRVEREATLKAAREAVDAANAALREADEQRLKLEQELEPIRKKIEDARLRQNSAEVNLAQFEEQLATLKVDAEWLTQALEKAPRAAELQRTVARVDGEIAQLGAVNLAALEELQQASERKLYLDAQAGDLAEAVQTLEDAIRRIDRETRAQLQDTYNKVNEQFGRLFPTLFGGGHAKLVLTGEEILDAGIQVVAQPPGKRNASIHLLSGGEKALTATALVFALFQLNPAPFCLLDEVDAPLDDPNTERFCRLVREMSAATQFLFISHNRIAMEMAEQLIGVTMNEPGVSRIVGVDVSQAMRMAEAA
ncbi:chromosome segregation protein SMC [Casimicrobium huifangae]|uniref:chromosome segregation protein SMC n=1 Tax=Casimicrobium huifangae TaxID=2591109 RepID=UPI0012EBF826|nr:chromosome segregation protein SMC [Casimicrobium huifangae]